MKAESTECGSCEGSGWEPVQVDGIRRVRRCEACDYWNRKRGVAPGVPVEEQASSFDNYESTKYNGDAIRQAMFFVDGVHPGLYLHGGTGSGKTRLACTILNAVWKAGTGCRFYRVPELLQRLMPGADSTEDAFDQAVRIPVIVLDDVGANAGTDFSRRMLQSIFDARLDRGHRTIWTSNLDLDELAQFLAEDMRLPSRIAGNAKVVELDGLDFRLKQAKARNTVAR